MDLVAHSQFEWVELLADDVMPSIQQAFRALLEGKTIFIPHPTAGEEFVYHRVLEFCLPNAKWFENPDGWSVNL